MRSSESVRRSKLTLTSGKARLIISIHVNVSLSTPLIRLCAQSSKDTSIDAKIMSASAKVEVLLEICVRFGVWVIKLKMSGLPAGTQRSAGHKG